MRRFAGVAAAVLGACAFDASVPAGAVIFCRGASECPPGWACQLSTERCVPEAELDPQPPGLVSGSTRLVIVPGAGNLHPAPTALTFGSEARISLSADEPLGRPPTITSSPALACYARVSGLADFELGCVLPPTFAGPDGLASLEVELVDVAGNRAQLPLDLVLPIDTAPPAPPATQTADAVIFTRIPWGSDQTGGAPRSTLEGAAGAAPGADYVAARSGESLLRGLVRANADGSFGPSRLVELDGPALEVTALDAAGNASAWVPVRDGRWVASFGGRRATDDSTNPHRVGFVGALGRGAARSDVSEWSGADGVDRTDGRTAQPGAGAAAWRRLGVTLPEALGRPTLAYDTVRARTLRFGGVQTQRVYFETTGWVEIGPPLGLTEVLGWGDHGWVPAAAGDPESDGEPRGRINAAAAFDRRAGHMYLHGGNGPSTTPGATDPTAGPLLSDSWVWTGASWRRLPSGPPLRGAAAFFDERDETLHLAGGDDGGAPVADAWAFDGVWTRVDAGLPEPIAWGALAFDPASHEAWLFGGRTRDGGVTNATWRWRDGAWSTQPVAGQVPEPRSHAAATWDEVNRRAVLFGGKRADGGVLRDTWLFDGQRWQAAAWGVPDAGADAPVAAFDTARGQLVLASGARTWLASAADGGGPWRSASATVVPHPDFHAPVACAEALGGCRLLLHSPASTAVLHDFGWVAEGETALPPLATAGFPGGWDQLLTAWDEPSRTLVAAYPNGVTRLWTIDGGWVAGASAGGLGRSSSMAATAGGTLAASAGPGRVVRFFDGGWVDAGTLPLPTNAPPWFSMNWAAVVATPTGAQVHGLQITRDDALNVCPPFACYMPGPTPTVGPRWGLDGGAWVELGDLADQSAVGAASWDALRQESFIAGGMTLGASRPTQVLFSVRGAAATPEPVSNADGDGVPLGRVGSAMAYDSTREVHVLHSGTDDAKVWAYWNNGVADVDQSVINEFLVLCALNWTCVRYRLAAIAPKANLTDSWLLSVSRERPAALGTFDLSAARLGREVPVQAIVVRASAGGSGMRRDQGAYVAQPGFRVKLWRDGRWQTLAENLAATPGSPASIEAFDSNPAPLRALYSGGPRLDVAVEPLGINGTGRALVGLDYLELELRYRLP